MISSINERTTSSPWSFTATPDRNHDYIGVAQSIASHKCGQLTIATVGHPQTDFDQSLHRALQDNANQFRTLQTQIQTLNGNNNFRAISLRLMKTADELASASTLGKYTILLNILRNLNPLTNWMARANTTTIAPRRLTIRGDLPMVYNQPHPSMV